MKTITLTGMMGSGKSSCAGLLAKNYNCRLFDVDREIELHAGRSISEIFENNGEEFFRNLEKTMILENAQPENMIIALGGGAFENPQVRKFLLEISTVVYLKTSAQTIYERIKTDLTRPLLKNNMNIDKIQSIIQKREYNYLKAYYTVVTDEKSIEQAVADIMGVL